MKKAIAALCFGSLMVMLVGCASSTQYGDCVGISDKQDPKLEYKISARNLIVGIFFFQLIIPPVLVVTDQFYCPVGVK